MTTKTLPKKPEKTCTDILAQAVEENPGIEGAVVDHRNHSLTLNYNRSVLTPQRANQIALALSQSINHHQTACNDDRRVQQVDCVEIPPENADAFRRVAVVDENKLHIEWEKPLKLTESALTKIEKHYREILEPPAPAEPVEPWWRRNLEAILTAISLITLLGGIIAGAVGAPHTVAVAFFVLSYMAGGYSGLKEGIESLKELQFDVNFLMLAAAIGAATIGAWEEGAILLFLFSLSGTLESYAMDRTHAAIESLMELSPDEALVKRDGREMLVPVEELQIGDTILIKPGERIAADGEIISGRSEIDQSPITGESIPVGKKPGDPVFAGTINGQGALEVRVTKPAQESTLAKIVQMVSEAQSQRSPTQRAIDWFGSRYTIAVILGTLATIFIPYLFMGWDFSTAFYRGMVLLVVASPCALVISTPASVLSAIANAAKNGILFKGGAHLENTGLVKVVAFDKTGTLTSGDPGVTDVIPLNGTPEDELLALAAATERRSEHHLAKAIVRAATRRELSIPDAEDFQAMMGRGAQAFVNGEEILVGKPGIFTLNGDEQRLRPIIDEFERTGKTVVLMSRNGKLSGLIAIADSVRPVAKEAVAALKRAGVSRVVMLTGDNERAAATIAAEAGVDEYFAELLPQDKVRILKELEAKYGAVAMVGDGVNDAPALAAATVGIAMGAAGTDVALETADVVLMADDLSKLPYAINLSRRSRRIIKQNLTFAGLVIVTLIASAVLGIVPLPIGVVGHEGSTLLVVLNGLRLLRSQ